MSNAFIFVTCRIPLNRPPVLQLSMARGWESKGVEEQQAEHGTTAMQAKPSRSLEQIARARRLDDLKLRRRHVLRQLEAAQIARHRQLLEDTLSYLDDQIRNLEQTP